ncbi:MAG: hypothetical protein J6I58_06745 [Eubacterium sp.]|nr:hypothetical protein [Eubacterium sp.]
MIKSDSDEKAWEFFMDCYKIKSPKISRGCKVGKWKYVDDSESQKSIDVSGEICFNLRLKDSRSTTFYGSILCDGKSLSQCGEAFQEKFLELNNILGYLQTSPYNICILPKPGGLNNIKKGIGNDRFDTYLWALYRYYKGEKAFIINGYAVAMSIVNRKILCDFLDEYKSTGSDSDSDNAMASLLSLCSDLYSFVRTKEGEDASQTKEYKLIKDLINNGIKPIASKSDFRRYIEFAIRFWELRRKGIYSHLKETHKEHFEKVCKKYEKDFEETNEKIKKMNKLLNTNIFDDSEANSFKEK